MRTAAQKAEGVLLTDGVTDGWLLTTLAEVCEVNPPKPPKDILPTEALVTFVPMPAVDADKGEITVLQTRPFGEVRKGYTAFREDDVILAKITPCMENGKAAIVQRLKNGLGFGSTEFHVLRSTGVVVPKIIYHFIRQESFRRTAEAEMTGSVGQKRVPHSFIEQSAFPLAPLAEQKRIAEKVEQLLARVNAARERLARVPTILKRFRQAVLTAACSGQLTAVWREKHAPELRRIKDLVNQLRDQNTSTSVWHDPSYEIRTEKDLPVGWTHIALGNFGSWATGGTPSKSKATYWQDGSVPWLSPKDMKSESISDTQDHITKRAVSETRLKILPSNTLLFVVRGMILAHTFPVAISSLPLTINQDMRAVTPHNGVLPDYLLRALQAESRSVLFAVRESTHGTRRLESETLKCWPIPLPIVEEQVEIVRRVETLFKLADAIEKRVAAATARTEKLTQAILAKAFRGQLVPTEAELARREGRSYEPASVLLDRIRAEENNGPTGKPQKRRAKRSQLRSS